jgi:hypothetical protein
VPGRGAGCCRSRRRAPCSGHIGRYDAALGLLAGSGLAAIEVAGCIAAVKSYTPGEAVAAFEAEQAPAATGSSDDEWWEQRAPLLAERTGGLFPRLAALERTITLTTNLSVMQVTLTGGLFDLPPLLRWLPVPARLGFVAEASYLDLNRLRAPSGATDPLWEHTASSPTRIAGPGTPRRRRGRTRRWQARHHLAPSAPSLTRPCGHWDARAPTRPGRRVSRVTPG